MFQTKHKNYVCLRVYIAPHWHLSLKSPFPVAVLLMAEQVTGSTPVGHYSCTKPGCTHCMLWHHGRHVLSTSTSLTSQATYSVGVVCGPNCSGKQLECLGELESNEVQPVSCQHIPSSPLSETRQLLWLHQGNFIRTPHQPRVLS